MFEQKNNITKKFLLSTLVFVVSFSIGFYITNKLISNDYTDLEYKYSTKENKNRGNDFSFKGDYDLKNSIITYKKDKTNDGINIIVARSRAEGVDFEKTLLIDMEGNVLHKWETDFNYPHKGTRTVNNDHLLLRLFPNGDALITTFNKGLARLDKNSNVIWNIEDRFHHDVRFYDEYIYSLSLGN